MYLVNNQSILYITLFGRITSKITCVNRQLITLNQEVTSVHLLKALKINNLFNLNILAFILNISGCHLVRYKKSNLT